MLALAALTLALVVPAAATAAPTKATCSDYGFKSQVWRSSDQTSTALDYLDLESYKAAEAWALRAWRTMRATSPCLATYRRFRQYELNGTAAVWNAVRAKRTGDLSEAMRLLRKAERWLDLSAAEQANW